MKSDTTRSHCHIVLVRRGCTVYPIPFRGSRVSFGPAFNKITLDAWTPKLKAREASNFLRSACEAPAEIENWIYWIAFAKFGKCSKFNWICPIEVTRNAVGSLKVATWLRYDGILLWAEQSRPEASLQCLSGHLAAFLRWPYSHHVENSLLEQIFKTHHLENQTVKNVVTHLRLSSILLTCMEEVEEVQRILSMPAQLGKMCRNLLRSKWNTVRSTFLDAVPPSPSPGMRAALLLVQSLRRTGVTSLQQNRGSLWKRREDSDWTGECHT